MEERPFGKTGEKFPILSYGAQRIVDSHNCSEADAIWKSEDWDNPVE